MKHSLTLLLLLAGLTVGAQTKDFKLGGTMISNTVIDTTHGLSIYKPSIIYDGRIYFLEVHKPYDTIISISPPDTSNIVTVKFNRKYVKFINDSTFIFKQPK